MFHKEEQFESILQLVLLVDYSPGYKLGEFNCGIEEYNMFLTKDAPYYIEQGIMRYDAFFAD